MSISNITAEYRAWVQIHQRCYNPNNPDYKHYGGRGIKVCKRWDKYENFLSDVGRKPSKEYSIDRIDVNGDYTPNNCKWSTRLEQSRNRRDTIRYKDKPLKEWCEKFNIAFGTAYERLNHGHNPFKKLPRGASSHKKVRTYA